MIDTATLDRTGLAQGLNAAARQALLMGATVRRFGSGQVLFVAGSQSRGLYVILEGSVRVLRVAADRQHVVHTEGPGGTLGEVPLFEGGTYPATAVASAPTVCVAFTRDALRAAMAADVSLAWTFLARLAGRVRGLVHRLDGLAAQSVQARLAALILARAGSGDGAFTLGGTHIEVAEELGTVREVIVRALRELKACGAVAARGRGRLVVRNADVLKRLAG
jgi:CRP/FNR family transcriptional regulator